jgi:hypothetical protein
MNPNAPKNRGAIGRVLKPLFHTARELISDRMPHAMRI